ncbi:pyruvate, phosphate dikinase [Microbacterium gorillae]|uniref:pyruvate, phosphate dikinase n=1 Tax=Microbacterium gorillae TaxID=1231063 RepID=UPI000590C7F1|nr:pyruvate, phosphate dikinase [Microbacterium gorillae]
MTTHVQYLDGTVKFTRAEVGGKAYSINEMRRLGMPVPPAFVLPTAECAVYREAGDRISEDAWDQITGAIAGLEAATGRTFGAGPSPLLLSVRSGAAESMPGMMDTVLNLGLNEELVDALASGSGDEEWAQDTWHRFVESYAIIVAGDATARPPQDPWEQLRAAIGAVFLSWESPRAVAYRSRHGLDGLSGTAVTVQAMVFGNRDSESGTGVLFSRNPSTGEAQMTGDWLARAQGEEVVSGSRTPETLDSFATSHPELHRELERIAALVEHELHDMADIEFTVESGRLYVLQSRVGKRSPTAAVHIAVDLVREGVIDQDEAVRRLSDEHVARLAETNSADTSAPVLARGAGIGTGVASGVAVTDVDEAEDRAMAGEDVVLVRGMTAPDDVPAMFESVAVVTETGGPTSHAALVCREIGLPCVVGCGAGTIAALVGKQITVDGTSGLIYEGAADIGTVSADAHLAEFLAYVDWPLPEGHTLAPLAHLVTTREVGR